MCSTGVDAKTVSKKFVDIFLSFHDVVSMGGYRDSVTPTQLESYLTMESTDEKIHKKGRMVREAEAKEKMKQHQKEISKKRKQAIAEGKDPYKVEGPREPEESKEPERIIPV